MPCPIIETIEVLAKKWTLMLLHQLSLNKRLRFNELQASMDSISPRTLSERLDELEKEGLVIRKAYAEIPPRVEYSLSEKGRDLIQGCFSPIEKWAKKWRK
ncbi:helix-turn-helix transcriptional regulator [Candidatus Micrarchaeota archaeon]|nr:helix-turn-helix transcriptional regulator [Candidatus Micrarchaeota archaeon]